MAIATIAVGGAIAGAQTATPPRGEVGGPPSDPIGRCPQRLRPCGEPIVLATASTFVGQVEIVGRDSRRGFCLRLIGLQSGLGGCGGPPTGPPGDAIREPQVSAGFGRGRDATKVLGYLRKDVDGLRARYTRRGTGRKAAAIIGRVTGPLLTDTGQASPFGVFAVVIRGCVAAGPIRLIALDAADRRIQELTVGEFPYACGTTATSGAARAGGP